MNAKEALSLIHIITGLIFAVSTILFSVSTFYSFLFIYKAKWTIFSFVKAWIGTASFFSIVASAYSAISYLSGCSISPNLLRMFSNTFCTFFLATALAASSIVRYKALLHGGESWKLRN